MHKPAKSLFERFQKKEAVPETESVQPQHNNLESELYQAHQEIESLKQKINQLHSELEKTKKQLSTMAKLLFKANAYVKVKEGENSLNRKIEEVLSNYGLQKI